MKDELAFEYEHVLKKDKDKFKKALDFCEPYKKFMNESKTERDAVRYIIETAKKSGYINLYDAKNVKGVDKLYVNNRDKSVVLFNIGKERIDKGNN